MNWHLTVGVIAGFLQVYSVIPYVRDILAGGTKPNAVSWTLWTLIQLTGIWIQVSSPDGFSWSLILMIATTFNTGLVVFLCALGYGYKKFGPIEWTCLPLALAALALYAVTRNGPLALAFLVVAYVVSDFPTIVKTWKDPLSEATFPWFLAAVATALGVASSTIYDIENLILPIYLTLGNGTIAAFAWFGQRRMSKPVV